PAAGGVDFLLRFRQTAGEGGDGAALHADVAVEHVRGGGDPAIADHEVEVGHAGYSSAAGWCARQWRAMSMRRQIHTPSWRCTWSRKRRSPAERPGRPTRRQCRPTDIIAGRAAPSA